MARNLKNKIVVITGGAEGIGFEIADKYLQEEAKVVILLDIADETGQEAADNLNTKHGGGRAVFIKCDVTKDLDAVWNQITETYETVDVLVNNAGVADENNSKLTIGINVVAVVDWSQRFWEHARTDKGGNGGTIVNLASIYAFKIDQYIPIYQATKFAVYGFTKSFGHTANFNKSGVRVLAICPGYTHTKLTKQIREMSEEYSEFTRRQPWQEPEAVGRAAVEVFENADSGTVWVIEGDQPIYEV